MKSTVKSGRKTSSSKSGTKSTPRGKSAAASRNAKNPPRNKMSSQKSAAGKSAPKKSSSAKDAGSSSQEESLKKIFHELLKDTLNAEKQLVKALPKIAKAATSPKLAKTVEKHLAETEKQVTRLEKVFQICELKVSGKKCEAMEGLVKEGQEAIKETPKGSWVRDVALIVASQKVEHYEIAAYGSLRSIASILGYEKAAELLQKTLDEESAADEKLTAISETVNPAAKSASSKGSSATGKKETMNAEKQGGKSSKVENAIYMEDEDENEDNDEGDYDHEGEEYDDDKEEKDDQRSGSLGNSL